MTCPGSGSLSYPLSSMLTWVKSSIFNHIVRLSRGWRKVWLGTTSSSPLPGIELSFQDVTFFFRLFRYYKSQTQNNPDFVIPLNIWHPGQLILFWARGIKWRKMVIHFAMLCISCTLSWCVFPLSPSSSSSWWRLVKNGFFQEGSKSKVWFYRDIQMYEYGNILKWAVMEQI